MIDSYKLEVFLCDQLTKKFETFLKYPHFKIFGIHIRKSIKRSKAITTNFPCLSH
jgi:hypothetical protein